jgi:hypothetical protein
MSDDEYKVSKNNEWVKLIIAVSATIIVPLVVAYISNVYSNSKQIELNAQLQMKYLELAVEILKQPPERTSIDLRNWAANIIDGLSSIKMNTNAHEELTFKGLPIVTNDKLHKDDNTFDEKKVTK